jgi:hypothetical protein
MVQAAPTKNTVNFLNSAALATLSPPAGFYSNIFSTPASL